MKKLTLLLIILLFGVSSCKKFLDKSPDIGLDENDVFTDFQATRGYLDNCYRSLLDIHDWQSQGYQRSNPNAMSDEAGTLFTNNFTIYLNAGDWLNKPSMGEIGWSGGPGGNGAVNSPVIQNAFYCLRIANQVIAKAPLIPNVSEEEKNKLVGQAYFFRAWNYFQIITRWGGMPIFDKVYNPNDDLDLPRLSYHESSVWMISDLDKAITLLPDLWPDEERGRTTKVAAMALKSMAQLYDASPLMQNDLNSIQNKGYSTEGCKLAAKYANEVLKYANAKTGGTNFRLLGTSEYKNIFYHEAFASDEELWYRMDAGTRDQARSLRVNYIPQHFSVGTGEDAASFTAPTQNIVDKFEIIKDGQAYPFDDPRSGYDPQKPFLNRDPRFYNDVIVPGEVWGVNAANQVLYMEMYDGGRDMLNTLNSNYTRNRMATGYVCKKFIWPEANGFSNQYTKFKVNSTYIRLAQIYLDYAEAMNEAYGPNADPDGYGMTAVQAINIIRNRAGMVNVLTEFTSSKELFRDRIRNERAVELMFENHRWHDLRRWMIAEEVFKKPIQGLRATAPANHASVANKSTLSLTYKTVNLTTELRTFQIRHYWYPVALNHVQSLYSFKQNPGW